VVKILLAIDGSEQSEAAVDELTRQLCPPDSEVRVISVSESPYFPKTFSEASVNMELYAELENTARERAGAAVENAAARLRPGAESRRLKVTTEVISGSPKRAILEDAEAFGADLIVVGSHGHGRIERFLLGSVAQAVALHARCSVEIVRSRNKANEGK
jgi:nucleotide-binding universal stress UspA family protein